MPLPTLRRGTGLARQNIKELSSSHRPDPRLKVRITVARSRERAVGKLSGSSIPKVRRSRQADVLRACHFSKGKLCIFVYWRGNTGPYSFRAVDQFDASESESQEEHWFKYSIQTPETTNPIKSKRTFTSNLRTKSKELSAAGTKTKIRAQTTFYVQSSNSSEKYTVNVGRLWLYCSLSFTNHGIWGHGK